MTERDDGMTKIHKQSPSESGWALIETMFALGVMAFSLSLAVGSAISIAETGRIAEARDQGAVYLASVLEEVRMTPASELANLQLPPAPMTAEVGIEFFDGQGTAITAADLASVRGGAPLVRVTVTVMSPRGHVSRVRASALAGGLQ